MLSELSQPIRRMVEEKANREQFRSYEHVMHEAVLKLYEHDASQGNTSSEELNYLVDWKLKSGMILLLAI